MNSVFLKEPTPVGQNHSSYRGAASGLGSGKSDVEVGFAVPHSTFASAREAQTLSHLRIESSLLLELKI